MSDLYDQDKALAEALRTCALQVNPEVNFRRLQIVACASWGMYVLAFQTPGAPSLKKTYGLTVEQFDALRAVVYGDALHTLPPKQNGV